MHLYSVQRKPNRIRVFMGVRSRDFCTDWEVDTARFAANYEGLPQLKDYGRGADLCKNDRASASQMGVIIKGIAAYVML
jgi:hypothetical protein